MIGSIDDRAFRGLLDLNLNRPQVLLDFVFCVARRLCVSTRFNTEQKREMLITRNMLYEKLEKWVRHICIIEIVGKLTMSRFKYTPFYFLYSLLDMVAPLVADPYVVSKSNPKTCCRVG